MQTIRDERGGAARVIDEEHQIATRSTRVLAKQAANLAIDGAAIQGLSRGIDASSKARETILDVPGEALVHRVLLVAPVCRTYISRA